MAFVLAPTITIEYSLRDNDGAQSTAEVLIPSATAAGAAVTFAAALRDLIAALSSATIVRMNVIIGYVESSIPSIAESDVEDKGVFLFNAANGQKSSIAVPSYSNSLLQTNNRDIDQSLDEPGDFITAMTAGIGGVAPCGASGSDLVSCRDAYKQNRGSHKSRGTRRG